MGTIQKTRVVSSTVAVLVWIGMAILGWSFHKNVSDWAGHSVEFWEIFKYIGRFFSSGGLEIKTEIIIAIIGAVGQLFLLLRRRKVND